MATLLIDRFRIRVSMLAVLGIVVVAVLSLGRFGRTSMCSRAAAHRIQNTDAVRNDVRQNTVAVTERISSIADRQAAANRADHALQLRELARSNPQAALAAVEQHEDAEVRLALLEVVFEAWAAVDVDGAAEWAATQHSLDPVRAFAAIFRGAAQPAADLIAFARKFSGNHPAHAPTFTRQLMYAFAEREQHELAAAFADATSAAHRIDLFAAAYSNWARSDPESAVLFSLRVADAKSRHVAASTSISIWAQTDPAGLVATAMNFPTGPEKDLALVNGVREWIALDPEQARAWIFRHGTTVRGIEKILDD